jgi:hypothetical protein
MMYIQGKPNSTTCTDTIAEEYAQCFDCDNQVEPTPDYTQANMDRADYLIRGRKTLIILMRFVQSM